MGIKDLLGLVGALLGPRERVILSFIGGFLVGLIIFGWWIWPVQWQDASPVDLEVSHRQAYLGTVARIYEVDPSVNIEQMLDIGSWGEAKLKRDLNRTYNDASPTDQKRLESLGRELDILVDGQVSKEGGRSPIGILLVFLVIVIGVGGVFVLGRLRQRGAGAAISVGGDPDKVAAARTQWTEDEAPMAQFVTSYAIGEDYYDQSFSIETPTGEFLGECGVGISEAIGVGDPKKVTAFEVWLFDKNDIRTVTKVLMTDHCYHDETLRGKLAPKGEAVLGGEGVPIDLGTASLRVQAKVIEMEYGDDNLPHNSFVTRLTIELAAWQLEAAGQRQDALPAI